MGNVYKKSVQYRFFLKPVVFRCKILKKQQQKKLKNPNSVNFCRHSGDMVELPNSRGRTEAAAAESWDCAWSRGVLGRAAGLLWQVFPTGGKPYTSQALTVYDLPPDPGGLNHNSNAPGTGRC